MLASLAGLTGASLRVVNTFMVAICGTRMHNTMNSFIAMVPMFGIFILLRNKDVTFRSLVLLAGMSGIGGGAFASSMSSISFFFPKRKQGLALGINAGLGNLGVSLSQLLVPLVTAGAYFGPLSGDALSANRRARAARCLSQRGGARPFSPQLSASRPFSPPTGRPRGLARDR